MLPVLAGAVALTLIGSRPPELVGADGIDAYQSKLAERLAQPEMLTNYVAYAIPNCTELTYAATAREVTSLDIRGIPDFYSKQVQKPALIEQVAVSGCGQSYQLNYTALRRKDDHLLRFLLQMPGQTIVPFVEQYSLYKLASVRALEARNASGETAPCKENAFVYDSRTLTKPRLDGSWEEIWSVAYCGTRTRVKFSLAPDHFSDGLTFKGEIVP